MTDNGESIRVEIYDRVYHLRSAEDEKYTRHLAKNLDAAMRNIAEQTRTVDSLRVAVLAAMHYADRYERLKQRYDSLSGSISERTERLRKALDAADNTAVG